MRSLYWIWQKHIVDLGCISHLSCMNGRRYEVFVYCIDWDVLINTPMNDITS